MDWQGSFPGSTAGSRPAPRDGPAGASTSSASNGATLRDASAPPYQAGQWPALRGSSETAGRPSPEPLCRWPGMASDRACPSQHNDLLPQYEDLGFHRRPRPEQIDDKPKNQSAEIQHPAEDHPILRLAPTGWNLRQGHPHSGLSMLICRIRARVSPAMTGRPPRARDFQRQ
jgi:hypothetical protein